MRRSWAVVGSVVVIGALAYGVRSLRKVPPHRTDDPSAPLTDVAGKPYVPEVNAAEARRQTLRAPDGGVIAQPPAAPQLPPATVVMPQLMPDPAHPPQWTAPRAVPPPPRPPDPFVPPPIAVDPTPGHHTNAE